MKKTILILICLISVQFLAYAQKSVLSPKLTAAVLKKNPIDINKDGAIQADECTLVAKLSLKDCELIDEDLSELKVFKSLTSLTLSRNKLTKIDLSLFPKIKSLYLDQNPITTFSLSDQPTLEYLDLGLCGLTEISVVNCSSLLRISVGGNKIVKYNFSQLPKLKEIVISSNNISGVLTLSNLPSLTLIDCKKNNFTKIELSGIENLTNLDCAQNALTSLPYQSLSKLTTLDCSKNQLTVLDVKSMPLLNTLNCENNKISVLNFENNKSLQYLRCANNTISSLTIPAGTPVVDVNVNFNGMKEFTLQGEHKTLLELRLSDNNLSALDIHLCPSLTHLSVLHNPLLKEIHVADPVAYTAGEKIYKYNKDPQVKWVQ